MKPKVRRAKPLHIIKHGNTWKALKPIPPITVEANPMDAFVKGMQIASQFNKGKEDGKENAFTVIKFIITIIDLKTWYGKAVMGIIMFIITLLVLKSTGLLDMLI